MTNNDLQNYALEREYPKDRPETFEYKIKFAGKKSIVIGNPEGMSIENIIRTSDLSIDSNQDNIIILGNIIGSSFSKNPFLTVDFGEDDPDKLNTYYKNIIEKKSYNDANIEFCTKQNVTFIMGNRELDLIKIKELVELENSYNKQYAEGSKSKFKVESLNAFYPFWVKYYFKDPYKIPSEFKFIKRFKKLFKSIDAEMLLFTLFYEKNRNKELLDELTTLAIVYFYKMGAEVEKYNEQKKQEKGEVSNSNQEENTGAETTEGTEGAGAGEETEETEIVKDNKYIKVPGKNILDKLDYLAYFVFKYFSDKQNFESLLKNAEFIVQLKVENSYYLFSHGGITEGMFDIISSSDMPTSIKKINDFINANYDMLSDIKKINKTESKDIVKYHNVSKENQAKYYNELIKQEECITDIQEIDFKHQSISDTNINTTYDYNLLLLYTLDRNISAINEQLNPPTQQVGGFVSRKNSKWAGIINDVKIFTKEYQEEITKYNEYLKKVIEKLLEEGGCVENNKPTKNLLLILMLAHSFNTDIFKNLLSNAQITSEKFKSKNYSVLINTIYDYRAKHSVPFKNVHQIIANSNNTAQTTEGNYDSIFHGAVIDCYETTVKGRQNERNYIISLDNSAIIKHYSYFDSKTCLYIEPNLKDIFNINQMGIKTTIQRINKPNIIIFQSLENLYKILNHKTKEKKITKDTKDRKTKETKVVYSVFGNLLCPSMNYYGIDKNNEIIFSESAIKAINFKKYKF